MVLNPNHNVIDEPSKKIAYKEGVATSRSEFRTQVTSEEVASSEEEAC